MMTGDTAYEGQDHEDEAFYLLALIAINSYC